MGDPAAIILTLALAVVGAAIAMVIINRSPSWQADHPVAVRRYAITGALTGTTVAVFWVGRFLGVW